MAVLVAWVQLYIVKELDERFNYWKRIISGQLNNTNTIENYIGVGNISGDELSSAMHDQILENNIEVKYMNVKSVKETKDGLLVENAKIP